MHGDNVIVSSALNRQSSVYLKTRILKPRGLI